MSYEKQTWVTGDVITADKLNHIENNLTSIIPLVIHDFDNLPLPCTEANWDGAVLIKKDPQYIKSDSDGLTKQDSEPTPYDALFNCYLYDFPNLDLETASIRFEANGQYIQASEWGLLTCEPVDEDFGTFDGLWLTETATALYIMIPNFGDQYLFPTNTQFSYISSNDGHDDR